MRGYAYYSPKTEAAPGGLCLSAFAIARRGEHFLVVKPREHPKWQEWAPNWDVYSAERLAEQYRLWRLPSAYLREGEGPDDAVRRVVEEQLGASRCFVRQQRTLSFHDPSSRFPGARHWDLCFVYDVDVEPAPAGRLPWLAELRWAAPGELRTDDFGSAIGDLALSLGLLGAVRTGSAPARNV
jgi:ADP-ribose pyrophosphatase YjhB (NUDIX family)